jgi:hypothetical protein
MSLYEKQLSSHWRSRALSLMRSNLEIHIRYASRKCSPRADALVNMARPYVYKRTAVMRCNQTWHAGSPKRWRMFLYKYVQHPNALHGKILPKNIYETSAEFVKKTYETSYRSSSLVLGESRRKRFRLRTRNPVIAPSEAITYTGTRMERSTECGCTRPLRVQMSANKHLNSAMRLRLCKKIAPTADMIFSWQNLHLTYFEDSPRMRVSLQRADPGKKKLPGADQPHTLPNGNAWPRSIDCFNSSAPA